MAIQGRKYTSSSSYRYGFNGKENDRETVGTGEGTQDYGMRIYNPSLGRFFSIDPATKKYPYNSPYNFAGNRPIWHVDIDGLGEGNPPSQIILHGSGTGNLIIVIADAKNIGYNFENKQNELHAGAYDLIVVKDFAQAAEWMSKNYSTPITYLELDVHGVSSTDKNNHGNIKLEHVTEEKSIWLKPTGMTKEATASFEGLKEIINQTEKDATVVVLACQAGNNETAVKKYATTLDDDTGGNRTYYFSKGATNIINGLVDEKGNDVYGPPNKSGTVKREALIVTEAYQEPGINLDKSGWEKINVQEGKAVSKTIDGNLIRTNNGGVKETINTQSND
jgi:RHS repeat-associated protein